VIKGFLDIAELLTADLMSSVEAKDIVTFILITYIERGQSPSLGGNVGQSKDSAISPRPRISNWPASGCRFVKLLPVHTFDDSMYKFSHKYHSDTTLSLGIS
jgi:hypothetical protein